MLKNISVVIISEQYRFIHYLVIFTDKAIKCIILITDCKFTVFIYLFDITHYIVSISNTVFDLISTVRFIPKPNRARHICCVVANFTVRDIFFPNLDVVDINRFTLISALNVSYRFNRHVANCNTFQRMQRIRFICIIVNLRNGAYNSFLFDATKRIINNTFAVTAGNLHIATVYFVNCRHVIKLITFKPIIFTRNFIFQRIKLTFLIINVFNLNIILRLLQ